MPHHLPHRHPPPQRLVIRRNPQKPPPCLRQHLHRRQTLHQHLSPNSARRTANARPNNRRSTGSDNAATSNTGTCLCTLPVPFSRPSGSARPAPPATPKLIPLRFIESANTNPL